MYQAGNCFRFPSPFRASMLAILLGGISSVCTHAQTQTLPDIVTCISKQGERQACKADASAGVALLHSKGESPCLLGKNWGYDDNGVWVSNGCGAEFVVGSTKEASGGSNPKPASGVTTSSEPEGGSAASTFVGMFEPYGQIRIHLAAFKDDAQVEDNATRMGINFATRGKIKVIAGTEWGVNLVRSETQFNLSSAPPADQFGELVTLTNPVFLPRLGFVGGDFGPFGKVTLGKEYAPQYDIASYTTDRFNVFGGQGTLAYVGVTDGGVTGTGRADRVVQYRNTFLKIFEVGLQGQFRGAGPTNGDGGAASLQVKVLPGVKIGGTYTRTNWPSTVKQQIQGLGGNADYFAFGTRVDWKILQFGGVYAHEHNGDWVNVPLASNPSQFATVVYNANGFEVYTRAGIGRLGLIGGYTSLDPKVRSTLLDPRFRTRYFILGGEWFFAKTAKLYTESRFDNDSVTATGEKGYNVFTIGFRYDFLWRTSHE
jgi:predicted porin